MSKKKFYVTTPIYYGTARPHLGSLYSTLIADVINRWQQLCGKKTYFLTGTDEHGQKIAQAAADAGKTPHEFVDSFVAAYKETWNTYHIEYNQFIRTTDPYHIQGVQELVLKLLDSGDIYKAMYKGWYCVPDETYVTAQSNGVKKAPACPSCGRPTVAIAEESYFFKLSKYADKLLNFYREHPEFIIPRERRNEVVSFVEAGLKDLSISRTTVSWGVPFPRDPEHVVYVWVDALCNYITALGYGDTRKKELFASCWPADIHVLGKDIVRFHAVYWPALLMAADLPLPRSLLVHGWITVDKQKMSKSLENVIDPVELAKRYDPEAIRYYLMRQIPISMDGDFSISDLEQRITSDLANDLGNLLNRTIVLALKYHLTSIEKIAAWSVRPKELQTKLTNVINEYRRHMDGYEIHRALACAWEGINHLNAYFHSQEPWKLAAQNNAMFHEVISATCHGLYAVGTLLWPIMPEKMTILLDAIGIRFDLDSDMMSKFQNNVWNQTFVLKPLENLFTKIEKEQLTPVATRAEAQNTSYVTIDDVSKIDLRVGTITHAEIIPDSQKLMKLSVDFGEFGKKQILAGVQQWYTSEELVGKQGVFVCNLKPRQMLGMESQGMMLIAGDKREKPALITVLSAVPNGSRLS